jgi:flavin reductase (DIM6/NTAB) family NADH-FMN oxidoreductase RutF
MDATDEFAELGGHLDYPMFIVTTAVGDRRAGCLVGFCTQCSVDPPRFAVFLSDKNFTFRMAQEAEALGVHVVPKGGGQLARLFGEETGNQMDKFEHCDWVPGALGVPLLEHCPDRFVGRIVGKVEIPGGDHEGFLLEPTDIEVAGDSFFPFSQAQQFEPGHEA